MSSQASQPRIESQPARSDEQPRRTNPFVANPSTVLPPSAPPQTQPTNSKPPEQAPPAYEIIAFETGNPETHSTIHGTLGLAPVSNTSSVIVVESVPGLMTSPDFCIFVRPFFDTILFIRPLRLQTEQNRYIVIVKFRTPPQAADFAKAYDGKHFLQGLVQETCILRTVNTIRFDEAPQAPSFPASSMFPEEEAEELHSSCPVCLDPLDASSKALVTTFCNHTMHAVCLAQWDSNRCPVCRHIHELTPEASTCMNCNNREDLWMCIVCAYVGCGFYKKKHAHAHFAETQHPFAMNLEDCIFWSGEKVPQGSVWDYVSERFVNRLLSSDDGKVVEVVHDVARGDAGASSSSAAAAACCSANEGIGIVEDEQDRALQAAVYASRMDAVVDEYRTKLERMETDHEAEKSKYTQEISSLQTELSHLHRLRKTFHKKSVETEKEMKSLKDKNAFLKSLNETLLRDKQAWSAEVEKLNVHLAGLKTEKQALEEQLRDLMMHLEAQSKIVGSTEACRSDISELHGGDVVRVGPSPRERLAMKTSRR
eukprot:gb/GEZJ01003789.1/.p1 GENE.gb/GEZJ01003789.1/~~gb/GEZJ01003789.1/.p1  ORF type:complete len:539 (+),score=65.02 gb/GEZJ01003789.1/:378-1994(+)